MPSENTVHVAIELSFDAASAWPGIIIGASPLHPLGVDDRSRSAESGGGLA